jgi:UDP-N-acetyl-D-glucosamine dehydrogenase
MKRFDFGVVGLGYVGLPLAVEASSSGLSVKGFDVAPDVVRAVNDGNSHIGDVSDEELRATLSSGRLTATTDMEDLAGCDAVSICVPTPLSKTRDPDVSYVLEATHAIRRSLRPGQLIVLESTTYPGTTRELLLPELESTGLKVGEDFFLCFSPERVDPGNTTWSTKNTPKVIGGVTDRCVERARALYGQFIDTIVPVSSADCAEMVKILENTFRAVNIGLVNEMAIIADRLGVDVWEVIDAAASKPFGFMKFVPGPGLGGHCIPIDPHYLAWRMKQLNYRTRFIELASEVNSEMPTWVFQKGQAALNHQRKSVNGSKVLIVGVAYKADISDVRESPAVDIIQLFEEAGAEASYFDEYVPRLRIGRKEYESVELADDVIAAQDLIVIATAHSGVDYERLLSGASCVVDTRNATRGAPSVSPLDQGWIVKA